MKQDKKQHKPPRFKGYRRLKLNEYVKTGDIVLVKYSNRNINSTFTTNCRTKDKYKAYADDMWYYRKIK